MKLHVLALAVVPLALAAPARAQEKYPALGVALDVPPKYGPIPVQPDEHWIVLRYVKDDKKVAPPPELYVVRLEAKPDPTPLPDPPPMTSLERYLAREWKTWRVTHTQAGKARPGWKSNEYELREKQDVLVGWALELGDDAHTWILLGFCAQAAAEKEIAAWRKCADKLAFFEPAAALPEADKWTKFYAKNTAFRNPELRIRLRSKLVGDWEAEDTENYLVVYHTKKESLINHFEKRLEGIRRSYVELFPPVGEIQAVSTVRICEDEQEFKQYGGPPGSAGYWNPSSEELVLYVFDGSGGTTQAGKEDSRIVLFHEAFHQYIHYAAGEIAPHSWFNEGYGDYFSGSEFNQYGEVGRVLVNPWRIQTIQGALSRRDNPGWSQMVAMEKAEYYGPNRYVNYAMGWSMIYFLNKCPAVKKRAAWKRILPTYFETLKAASAREHARLESAGLVKNEVEVEKAAKVARDEAVKAAFEGVDMLEIQDAWREFVLDLKPPK